MRQMKTNRISAAALTVLMCIVTGCGSEKQVKLIENLPEVNFDVDYPVGQITKDVTVTQSFVSNCNEIENIQIYGATYIRENTATVKVRVLLLEEAGAMDGEEIAVFTIDSAQMEDNTIVELPFGEDAEKAPCIKEVQCSKDLNKRLFGKTCLIEITSFDGAPDLSPTFWMTEEDVYAEGALSIAGYEQYNDLWFQVEGVK